MASKHKWEPIWRIPGGTGGTGYFRCLDCNLRMHGCICGGDHVATWGCDCGYENTVAYYSGDYPVVMANDHYRGDYRVVVETDGSEEKEPPCQKNC